MKRLKLFLLATLMIISSLTFAQDKPLEKVKVSGFVQGLYQVDIKDSDNIDNSFRMRRVRMSISGDLNKVISYKIQGDFSSTPTLVDAFVKAKFCDAFAVQFGQFKLPFSIESPINPVDLEAVDYGDVITKLVGYSDVCGVGGLGRDLGLMFTGKVMKIGKDEHYLFDYSIGVFNGTGPYKYGSNSKDDNREKEFVGRLNIKPIKSVTASFSYYTGHYGPDALKRNRVGFGAEFNNNKVVARTEFISGKTGTSTEIIDENEVVIGKKIGSYDSFGMYSVAGYWFDFTCHENPMRLLPFVRYDYFAKDADAKVGQYGIFTFGANFLPNKFLSLKVNYQLRQDTVYKEGSTEDTEGKTSHVIKCMVSYKF